MKPTTKFKIDRSKCAALSTSPPYGQCPTPPVDGHLTCSVHLAQVRRELDAIMARERAERKRLGLCW